jgi:tRNA threonylcarbamoyladenosine biosynthesis protein TsaB
MAAARGRAHGWDLGLETSRRASSIALARDGRVLEDPPRAGAHASDLLARLEGLLQALGAPAATRPLALRAVFVGLGPGSFTGLRVGIATAQALAHATGAALYGLPSFEALAFAGLAPGEEGAVLMDARAGRFYHARYRRTLEDVEVLEAPAALTADELGARCAQPGVLLGQPGIAEAAGLGRATSERVRTDAEPHARTLLTMGRARAAAGRIVPAPALEPLYLVPFGAARARR